MTTDSQEKMYRVYIDAMIPSYLVAPLSRDPKIAEWQATWNFTHLANVNTRSKIEQICRDAGYSPPRIDTPQAILEETHV